MASAQVNQAETAATTAAPGPRLSGVTTDRLIILLFALAAVLFFLARWQGISPFAFLDGDGANVASFAASRANPGAFVGDALLAEARATGFYINFHTVWASTVGRALDDYGLAYLLLLLPIVFLHLALFYALGRSLFESRLGALLLTLMAAVTVRIPLAEYWGLYPDPQPRALFAALLPLVLIMVVRWRDRPERWVLPMALLGALTYVHPVSAPPVAGAVWLGLATLYQPQIGLRRHLLGLALAAGAFLLLMAPFALLYFGAGGGSVDPSLNGAARLVMAERFSPGFMDVPLAVWLFVKSWISPRILLPLAAAVSAVFLWTRRPQTRRLLIFFAAMAVGLLVCGYGLPMLDHLIARASDGLPRLIDFMRASRYLVIIMLIVAVWGAAEAARGRRGLIALAIACLVVPLGWAVLNKSPILQAPLRLATCAAHAKLLCGPSPAEADRLALLAHLEKAPRAVLVSLAQDDTALDIRYVAERPLAFSWKDGGAFGYSDPVKLLAWAREWRRMTPLQDGAPSWPQAAAFAAGVHADQVILDAQDAAGVPAGAVCFRSERYVLAAVDGTCER
jgi:hypothetical protein